MNHLWKGEPEKPWAGLTFYWLVYFFIGFHDFTCACVHFLGFCSFIGVSHFSLGDITPFEKQHRIQKQGRKQTKMETLTCA